MPPATSGSGDGGMKHALVSVTGTTVAVHISEPPTDVAPVSPVVMTSGHGVDYAPGKFDVLEGVSFNAQYGWLPGSALNTPLLAVQCCQSPPLPLRQLTSDNQPLAVGVPGRR